MRHVECWFGVSVKFVTEDYLKNVKDWESRFEVGYLWFGTGRCQENSEFKIGMFARVSIHNLFFTGDFNWEFYMANNSVLPHDY